MGKTKRRKGLRPRSTSKQRHKGAKVKRKKTLGPGVKDKVETAEYVGHLVELHKVQGAVIRLLQKSLDD